MKIVKAFFRFCYAFCRSGSGLDLPSWSVGGVVAFDAPAAKIQCTQCILNTKYDKEKCIFFYLSSIGKRKAACYLKCPTCPNQKSALKKFKGRTAGKDFFQDFLGHWKQKAHCTAVELFFSFVHFEVGFGFGMI